MKLTLVRHTTPDVASGTCYGWTDLPVAPTFRDEAAAVSEALDVALYDRIYSSPLLRCCELARYCCGEREVILDDDLKEMNFGEWEMMRYDSCDDPRLSDFFSDYLNFRCPGGESFRDLGDRVRRFISHLDSCDDNVLVFTHGGVIAHFRILAGMALSDRPFVNAPGYGSITTLSL